MTLSGCRTGVADFSNILKLTLVLDHPSLRRLASGSQVRIRQNFNFPGTTVQVAAPMIEYMEQIHLV